MKIVKSISLKKNLKRRKLGVQFCLSLGWLNNSEKKVIEHYNFNCAGAQKVGIVFSLWRNFGPNFTDIWKV